MKRFLSLIALAAFSIASQMQNAHAFDMFAMDGHWDIHGSEGRISVFCDQNEPSSDCAENPVPKDAAFLRKTFESDEKSETSAKWKTDSAGRATTGKRFFHVAGEIPPDKPENSEKNAYASRIGHDVKRLD